MDRFERDERAALGPLAPRPYHSLALPLEKTERSRKPRLASAAIPRVGVCPDENDCFFSLDLVDDDDTATSPEAVVFEVDEECDDSAAEASCTTR